MLAVLKNGSSPCDKSALDWVWTWRKKPVHSRIVLRQLTVDVKPVHKDRPTLGLFRVTLTILLCICCGVDVRDNSAV